MNESKSNSKPKEIFSIIKSGITGALALTGLCIILFILGYAVRNPFISRLYSATFAKCTFEGLFIATSGFGFILGILARRRLTLKNEVVLIAAFSVPVIIGAWWLHTLASYSVYVGKMKLADCTNSVTSIHLKAPRGHDFRFTLTVPSATTNTLSGHIEILDGKSTVTNFLIGIQRAEQQCDFLHGQTNYDINIFFDQPPPPSTSIWLYWKEGYKDRHG